MNHGARDWNTLPRALRRDSIPRDFASLGFSVLGFAVAATLLLWSRTMAEGGLAQTSPQLTDGLFFVVTIAMLGTARWLGVASWGEAFNATLVLIGPIVPFLAAMGISLLYVRGGLQRHADPLFLGLGSALAVWIFATPPLLWMARADTAQTRSYGEVAQRMRRAAAHLQASRAQPEPNDRQRGLLISAEANLAWLAAEVGGEGPPGAGFRFANATGYINLWRALHRVEEALLGLMPEPEALAAGMYDAFRIGGIPNGAKLIEKIQKALAVFGDPAAPAICDDKVTPKDTPDAKEVARSVLVEVRHALNVDQDDTWERLVRQRNRLLRTVLVTSSVGLLLVALAVTFKVGPEALASAAVFYLVGALIGLFARLRAENRAGPAVDDYGLFEARLLATLLLSGLASVVGVVVVASGAGLLVGNAASDAPIELSKVFSLTDNARGLLTAAVFGLTPELLTGWLSKQSDAVMVELARSSPAQGA